MRLAFGLRRRPRLFRPVLKRGVPAKTVDDLDVITDATEALTQYVPDDLIRQECHNVWLSRGLGKCPGCGAREVDWRTEFWRRRTPVPDGVYRAVERVDRQAIVTQLVLAGEIGHAERFATCRRRSVQLRCEEVNFLAPDDPRNGCGSTDDYVPMHCDSRLCIACSRRRMGSLIGDYLPVVGKMRQPTLVTLTIENSTTPEKGKEQIKRAFRLLRQRGIPFEGETVREGKRKRWVWSRSDVEDAAGELPEVE